MVDRQEPDEDQLVRLFRMLLGPEDEWDDAAAEAVLELHGIDPQGVKERLRERLEQEVALREGVGKEVPSAMFAALASFESKPELQDEGVLDVKVWIANLLAGIRPEGLTSRIGGSHLESFRSRKMESLSKKDRRILESLAAELRSEAEDERDG